MTAEKDDLRLLEVVELSSFAREADVLLSREDLALLTGELATHRQLGSVIRGTGGLRKVRWGAQGRGKRGGVRVIYYYGGDHMPLFLIAIYAKSEKADLSQAERKAAAKLIEVLRREYD